MIHREASHFPARGNLQQGRERACQSHMQLVAPGEKGIPSPPGKSRLLQGTEVGAGEESLRNVRGFQWRYRDLLSQAMLGRWGLVS